MLFFHVSFALILKEVCVYYMPLYGVCAGSKLSTEHMILQTAWVIQLFCHLDEAPPLERENSLAKVLTGELAHRHSHVLRMLFSIKDDQNVLNNDAQCMVTPQTEASVCMFVGGYVCMKHSI